MRIAIVSDFFLDYVGGAQSSIAEQKAALEAAQHTVRIISNVRGLRTRVLNSSAGDLHVRPQYTIPGAEFPVVNASPALVARLRDYLADSRVDVLHVQTEFGLAHAAAAAARSLGIPVVFTVHTFYWQTTGVWPGLLSPLLRRVAEAAVRIPLPDRVLTPRASDNVLRNLTLGMATRADRVVSPSAHQAADLAAAGVTGSIAVIPNPIARTTGMPRVVELPDGARPRIVWIARCEPEKRPLAFADAAILALERTGRGFDVDIVGQGGELAEVRRRTAAHPEIRVHGSLPRDAVIELIDASSVVVLTSVGFDNQPMTIAEATSRHRGVIFCDPQLKEGLDHAGLLTRDETPNGIAATLVDLVTHPHRFTQLSLGARTDSETFSAPVYVERISRVYRDALDRKNRVN